MLVALPLLAVLSMGDTARVDGEERLSVVATVGRTPITKPELADYQFARYRAQYLRSLDELIDERVARTVARQAGVGVPPDVLRQAIDKEVEARREVQKDMYGEGDSLEAWVGRGYGVGVDEWREGILRPRIEGVLIRQRVARLENRRELRLHVRLIVCGSAEAANRVLQKLRAGADFSLTALKESEDATKSVGGTLPPIARGDLAAYPVVEQKLFEAAPGSLLGPLRVNVEGTPQWQIYKVVRRDEPWRLSGQALSEALEEDLESRPMTRAEYEAWRLRLRKERAVRYFRPDGSGWQPPR
jgi:hypothetical protein